MKRKLLLAVLVSMLLTVTACDATLPAGESGQIALTPFTSEELGLRGIRPWACGEGDSGTFDCTALSSSESLAILIQQSFPGTFDDLVPLLLEAVNLEKLPETTGGYRGKTFDWDLYSFEAQILELGTEIYRIDLALTPGDSASYYVALVTNPDDYEANAALYETVFTHALYALAALP